jgi:hypothetical protein
MGLGQLFEIKPSNRKGSKLRQELGAIRFESKEDLTCGFPGSLAGGPGTLGFSNLPQIGKYFGENLWPAALGRMVMRITHKPVALA